MENEMKELFINQNKRLDQHEKLMQQLIDMVAKNNGNQQKMADRLDQMDNRLDQMEVRLDRIEKTQEYTLATLKQINEKLEQKDYNLQALNKRVFQIESDIERLSNVT